MSATKFTAKWLKTATLAEVEQERATLAEVEQERGALKACHEAEKNPMKRSSLAQRIVMCDTRLKQLTS